VLQSSLRVLICCDWSLPAQRLCRDLLSGNKKEKINHFRGSQCSPFFLIHDILILPALPQDLAAAALLIPFI
jgi:hypothetical protein